MKEISFSFQVKIALKRRDVLDRGGVFEDKVRVFLEVLKRILEKSEEKRLQWVRRCSKWGGKVNQIWARQVKKINKGGHFSVPIDRKPNLSARFLVLGNFYPFWWLQR